MLTGTPHELSLADLIQVGAANRRTLQVRVRSGRARGELYLAAGEVTHAIYGDLVGDAAVHAMLAEPGLRYEVARGTPAGLVTVRSSWQHLLLDAARQQDEGVTPRAVSVVEEPPVRTWLRRAAYVSLGAAMAAAVIALVWPLVPDRPAPIMGGDPVRVARAQEPVDAASLAGPGDSPPHAEHTPPAPLPASGLALRPTIVVRLLVDERGQVAESRIYRSRLELSAFEDAALAAVRDYRFRPARRGGREISAWLNWPVAFAHPETVRQALRIKGSDTIGGELGPALAKAFAASHAVDVQWEGLGSGTAFVGLFDGSADLGASSRPISDKELAEAARLGVALEEVVIGYDGIAVVVHPDNPVAQLSLAQVAAVFTGKVDRWSQVGGPDLPIHRLSRPSYSGTHTFFREHVLAKAELAAGTEWIEESSELVARVAADPAAVTFVGMGWAGRGVRAVPLTNEGDPVPPSPATVRNGSYPIYRPLLVYTRGAPRGAVASLLRFVLSAEGRQIVEAHGFIASEVDADRQIAAGAEAESAAPASAGPAVRCFFAAGSARLDAPCLAELRALGEGRRLLVVGHADAEGSSTAVQRLAARRAQAVAAHLRRLGASELTLEAAGSERPLATNQTGAGRERNRRVEVFLLAS